MPTGTVVTSLHSCLSVQTSTCVCLSEYSVAQQFARKLPGNVRFYVFTAGLKRIWVLQGCDTVFLHVRRQRRAGLIGIEEADSTILETLGTAYSATQCHIPEDLNPYKVVPHVTADSEWCAWNLHLNKEHCTLYVMSTKPKSLVTKHVGSVLPCSRHTCIC